MVSITDLLLVSYLFINTLCGLGLLFTMAGIDEFNRKHLAKDLRSVWGLYLIPFTQILLWTVFKDD
jgi:hypothetical protein